MNGCLIPDTPIVVDLWKRADTPSSKVYFLSHMHSDHTRGLSASWRWPIHCSALSAKLLVAKFQIRESLLRPMELDQSHIVRLDRAGRESMTVTLFNANHCPGSVMFLFEGYFGRVLYTGDFRYAPATFPDCLLGSGSPVDKLYLDNTFNDPQCRFPSREECKRTIMDILAGHPEHEVVLGVYTLGKEDLLVDIALALKTRVVVSPARLRMLQVLEARDVFTTDQDMGCVRLVPQRAINKRNMARWNRDTPTIAIIPTGRLTMSDSPPFVRPEDVFIVPYSDHSSYPELRQFVSRVHPRAIVPIVKDSRFMTGHRSVSDMHNFDDLLNPTPSAPFTIPPSVLQLMSTDFSCGSRATFTLLVEARRHQKLIRSSRAATGVVYGDEDDDAGTTTAQSAKPSATAGSPQQEQPPAASENSRPDERMTRPSQPARSVSHQIKETEASTREVASETKSLPTEPRHRSSSENRSTVASEGTGARVKDFLSNKYKRKFDHSHESTGDPDSVLIRSMSSKKPRVLPEFCVANPRSVVNVPSCRPLESRPSSNMIPDYFKALNVVSRGKEFIISGSPKQIKETNPRVCSTSLVPSVKAAHSLDGKASDRNVASGYYARQSEVVDIDKLIESFISEVPLKRGDVNDAESAFSPRHICVKTTQQIARQKNRSIHDAFEKCLVRMKKK